MNVDQHSFIDRKKMVDVSLESPSQIEDRLHEVIRLARLDIYPAPYTFEEMPIGGFPDMARPDSLAFIRDDEVWSQLVPARPGDEAFRLLRFHFPANVDNSGFVGWLASRFKRRCGTGVFVVCGQNSADGGIYDYWGIPLSVSDAVIADLGRLRAG